MKLVIHLDPLGLAQVELISTLGEQESAHRFFHELEPELRSLDAVVKRISSEDSDRGSNNGHGLLARPTL